MATILENWVFPTSSYLMRLSWCPTSFSAAKFVDISSIDTDGSHPWNRKQEDNEAVDQKE